MSEELLEQDSQIEEQPVEEVEEIEVEEIIEEEISESEETNQPDLFNIDGIGEVTVEEIKEWRQGNLRQSDYTKKTQAIAKEREDLEDALELYNYLKANPEVARRLQNDDDEIDDGIKNKVNRLTPEMQRLEDLERKIARDELDRELDGLKTKYPDFDDVKVLTEAQRRNIDDLEFVYKALSREEKSPVDVDKIKAEAVSEAKKQIMEELKLNSETTQTIVSGGVSKPIQTPKTLTPSQKRVAIGMGVSEEDYLKWI